jgi:hypothetical protein
MTVMAMIVLTNEQAAAATALNNMWVMVEPRLIDNPLANALGFGVLVGRFVITARVLNDPDYQAWSEWFFDYTEEDRPAIRLVDTDMIFIPQPEE